MGRCFKALHVQWGRGGRCGERPRRCPRGPAPAACPRPGDLPVLLPKCCLHFTLSLGDNRQGAGASPGLSLQRPRTWASGLPWRQPGSVTRHTVLSLMCGSGAFAGDLRNSVGISQSSSNRAGFDILTSGATGQERARILLEGADRWPSPSWRRAAGHGTEVPFSGRGASPSSLTPRPAG